MSHINDLISQNFQDNISYLEQNHKDVYDKVLALESAIANGYYQEKYALVYENDGFDVKESNLENHLYHKESLAHTLLSANSVNNQTNNYTIEGFVQHRFSKDDISSLEKETNNFEYKKYIAPILYKIQTEEQHELVKLNKFVFFGVGLGLHILDIHKKIASSTYLIIEDDLELFRLSLFCTNYQKLAQNAKVYFSIFESQDEFMATASSFLEEKYYQNHYIKFFHLPNQAEEKILNFQQAVSSQPHLRFLFTDMLLQSTQVLSNLSNNYSFMKNSLSFNSSQFQETPFLLIASGPSLQKELNWLKVNYKNFITVAVSSSLHFLEEHAITPNIIIHMDPFEQSFISFQKIKNIKFIENSIFLCSASTPKSIIKLIDKKQIFFFETSTHYKEDSFKTLAPCIGSTAYQFLLQCKTSHLYLLGLDLAIDSETGMTHSGNHQDNTTLKLNKNGNSFKKDLIKVEGNFTKEVQTTADFYISLFTINNLSKYLKTEEQTVYNLSNGAKILNSIPLHTHDFISKSSHNPFQKVFDNIRQYSSSEFSKNESMSIKEELMYAQNIKKTLLNITIDKATTIDIYLEYFIQETRSQSKKNSYELSVILDSFYHYLFSYIYNHYQNDSTPLDLHTLHQLLLQSIFNIIDNYINFLNKVLHAKH